MEQNLNNQNTPPAQEEAALGWACDVLGLEPDGHAINKRETRRAALTAFFNQLKVNDFHASDNSAVAVELIHGKDAQLSPAYVRRQQRKQLRQLDALVRWFASQLGIQDHQQLRTSLARQLSHFNSAEHSEQVKKYGTKIWQAAESVASPAHETNVAAKKILQALFHVATIRSTQRNAVRRQHVVRLKKEFSKEQLTEARNTIWRHHDTPNEVFHRPFMSLLTCDEDSVDAYQIRQPVASAAAAIPYQDGYSELSPNNDNAEGEGVNYKMIALVIACCLAGLVARFVSHANDNKPARPKPAWSTTVNKPNVKFDPTLSPEDPRSAESALRVLRQIQGKDSKLPTLDEFKVAKEKAARARQRIDERAARAKERREDQLEELNSRKFIDEALRQNEKQMGILGREHDRVREQQRKMDAAVKAMVDFTSKKKAKKEKQLDGATQPAPPRFQRAFIAPGNSIHDATQRHIEYQQRALDEARKQESIIPSLKTINDATQRQIDMEQKRLDESRGLESKSGSPNLPSSFESVEDIMKSHRERHQKMLDESRARREKIREQMERARGGKRDRSNRLPSYLPQ